MKKHVKDPKKVKAGKTLLKKRGRDYYSKIGKKGRRQQIKDLAALKALVATKS